MRKILLISYVYPPVNNAGAHRIAGFTRHLPGCGYQPVVLTVRNTHYSDFDAELLDDLPNDLLLHRTFAFDYFNFLRWLRGAPKAGAGPSAEDLKAGESNLSLSRRGFRFINDLVLQYVLVPDVEIGWTPTALLRGRKICREEGIDAILTSSPPDSVHLIGLGLKKWLGLPWIADFRDQWTTNVLHREKYRRRIIYRIHQRLERAVLRRADAILANSETNGAVLKQTYPDLCPTKIQVVPNGFEGEPARHLEPASAEGPLRLQFSGMAYATMLDPLWEALELLHRRTPGVASQIEVQIVGWLDGEQLKQLELRGLGDRVKYEGAVSRKQSVERMLGCDVLLYAVPGEAACRGWIPSKLYSYLASGRPVLALAPQGDAAEIVLQCRAGWVESPSDPAAVASRLERLLELKRAGRLRVERDLNWIGRYRRKDLAASLARIVDALLGAAGGEAESPPPAHS